MSDDATSPEKPPEKMTGADVRAVAAATLGWTMDAFDYFVVVLVYADVGDRPRTSRPTRMAFLTTVDAADASGRARRCSACGPTRSGARRS